MSRERASVIWHDVECGAYAADLPLWDELADAAGDPILELGCGTGRVSLHLARRGHRVVGLDIDDELLGAFAEGARGWPVAAVRGDAREFEIPLEFALVLAPMQLIQLFDEAAERISCLRCIGRHLSAGRRAALAIVDGVPPAEDAGPPLPDSSEVDGWVYSSLPLGADADSEAIVIRRLRQRVSPEGRLSDEVSEVRLSLVAPETLEREGEAAGLRPAGRRAIPATDAHAGSTVVLLEREA
jgi:SAM-dependent methyltransferase